MTRIKPPRKPDIDDTLTGVPPAPLAEKLAPPRRRRLPDERQAATHKFKIFTKSSDGQVEVSKGYMTVGFYDDGEVGEIFIKMDKQGSQVSGFVDSFAIAISMLLQVGVPLEGIIAKFKNTQFEPSGMTGNPLFPFARSPIDLVCRMLEVKYLKKEERDDGDE